MPKKHEKTETPPPSTRNSKTSETNQHRNKPRTLAHPNHKPKQYLLTNTQTKTGHYRNELRTTNRNNTPNKQKQPRIIRSNKTSETEQHLNKPKTLTHMNHKTETVTEF